MLATTRDHLTAARWALLDITSGHVNLTLQHTTIAARMVVRTPVTIFRSVPDVVQHPSDAELFEFLRCPYPLWPIGSHPVAVVGDKPSIPADPFSVDGL